VLAAVTSTATLSRLGAAGTLWGAGIAATITVLGNYLYTRSLVHTHQAVRRLAKTATATAAAVLPLGRPTPADGAAESEGEAPASSSEENETTDDAVESDPTVPDRWLVVHWNRLTERFGLARVFVAAVLAVFLLIVGIVTVVELASGRSLPEMVGSHYVSGDVSLPSVLKPGKGGAAAPSISPVSPGPSDSAGGQGKAPAGPTGEPEESAEPTAKASKSPKPSRTPGATPGTTPATPMPTPTVTVTVTPPPAATSTVTAPAPAPTGTAAPGPTAPPAHSPTPPPSTPTPTEPSTPTPTETGPSPTPSESASGEPGVEDEAARQEPARSGRLS
jgi:hypothetical protein